MQRTPQGGPTSGSAAPGPAVRIELAHALPDLGVLEPLARRVFGRGDRPAGWFRRKLRREQVRAELSALAVRAEAGVEDPEGWLGYVLVGTPASLGDAARTSGTGVVPAARGRAIASRLLDAVARACHDAGYRRLQLLAEARLVPFYRRRGFDAGRPTVTALGFATGDVRGRDRDREVLGPALPWRPLEPGEHTRVAWLPEAWAGTEAHARRTCAWTDAGTQVTAWISREGQAWLVQRLVSRGPGTLATIAAGLLDRLPRAAPVLLPLLPADDPQTRALLDDRFVAAQRGSLLERSLDD
ncbi:MAG: GNAT family N-acetyltransferase [Nannocystaceae bacterium]